MPFHPPLRKESEDLRHKYIIFLKRIFLNFAGGIFILTACFQISAQETEKKKPDYDLDHPERRVTTYLDVHHAVRNIKNLKEQAKLDVIRLNKITTNFKGKVQGADEEYKAIKENYKKGIDQYYRREYLDSSFTLKDTRKMSQDLYKKFAEHFQKQVGELLNSCSESMVNYELRNLADQISIDQMRQNQYRLKIAYNQVFYADQMTRDNRYDAALDHLRLAKLYAIQVLKNMEPDESKKAAMDKQYEADIIDAMGGVVGNASTGNPS